MRLVVLTAGVVVLAVGVGLGPRHYLEEGLSRPAVLGFVLLGAGLVVSVWAAIRILAATRRRWWALILALVLVATYLVVWTLGQAVAATYAPRPELGVRTPADLGLGYRDVTFPSSDGEELAGWYIPTRNGAAVALMHGAGSTRSAVLERAAVLAEHGYGVLLFDARGHGESGGRAMDFGWYGESDAIGAVDFLTQQRDVSRGRIGLLGLSMGGEQAIGAAGVDGRVVAVVAEGATSRVAADKTYLDVYGVRGEVQSASTRPPSGSPVCWPRPPSRAPCVNQYREPLPGPTPLASCSSRPGRCRTRATLPARCRARAGAQSRPGPFPAPVTPKDSREHPPSGSNE